ncbi:hypothetical protein RM572_00360 [Streptomyces sp. DSM 42041]|uniref:Uncharacterized protein n=1 Tax=Streptomyces hazeniae TaxID=3075538 RepID=A0ABU2NLW5_9ACTN|nr:hypothetical protein [Streptomyces sp. DSM 42041]MDT0377228.1 hypothetical protein [Streptomyces sp. DSM 42041]
MSKSSGLGDQLLIAGYDLGEDIGQVGNIGGGNAPIPCTGITKSAMQRLGGKRDGRMEYTAYFNPSAGRVHERLSPLPRADVLVTYLHTETLGKPAACCVAKQLNYDGTRGDDGSFRFAVAAQANGFGLEWGRQLTPGVRDDTGATNGTGVDFGTGSTTFGLQAYLHVTEFTGTDVTIKLQQSSDDGSADAYADVTGGAFTEVTSGPTWERIATADDQTVERYLRVVTTTTAGFTSLSFQVTVARNDAVVTF